MAASVKKDQKKTYDDLFNKVTVKDKFLGQYPKPTADTYIRIFDRSKEAEQAMNKDLYDFNKMEIEDILYDLNPLTNGVSQSNGRIISAYINWAIDKGLRENPINPLKTVDASWFEKFVDKSKKLYLSLAEIRNLENYCENAQDAVILSLLFDGIVGKECAEIRNIKKNDFNEESCVVRATDEMNNQRFVKVSENSIRLLKEAAREKNYVKKNGFMVNNTHGESSLLLESDYVLRSSRTVSKVEKEDHTRTDEAVSVAVIYRRITSLSKTLAVPYLTTKNVFRSGVIYYGYQLLQKYGELGKMQYELIAEKFKINNAYSIKEYCNLETINELYPNDAKQDNA